MSLDRPLLTQGAAALGVPLEAAALEAFETYLALLLRWNARINLTRIVDPREVTVRHFLDCLTVVPRLTGVGSLVDVGSGAGFPGAVIAIVRSDLAIRLVEPVAKKAAFLEALKRALGLRVEIEVGRLEALLDRGARFDAAVSRATFAPGEWIARGGPLVGPGGLMMAMLGAERPVLVAPPGFGAPEMMDYQLPGTERRALVVVRREASACFT